MTRGVRPRRLDLAMMVAALSGEGCVKVDCGAIVFVRGDASSPEIAVTVDAGTPLDVADATVEDSPDTPADVMDAPTSPRDVPTPTDAPTEINDGGLSPDVFPTVDSAPDVPMSGCPSGMILCAGVCVDLNTDSAHCGACGRACPASIPCLTGVCGAACSLPMVMCGLSCVDLNTDRAHCGMCGAACPVGRNCVGGVCVP